MEIRLTRLGNFHARLEKSHYTPPATPATPAKSIMDTRGPQNGQRGVQRGLTIGSAAGRAARYKKRYSVLSFLLIKDWIPYQVKATRDFIPFSKGM